MSNTNEISGIIRDKNGRIVPGSRSLNPGGRPKNAFPLTELLNEMLFDEFETENLDGEKVVMQYGQAVIVRKLKKAIEEGDDRMIEAIFNRIDLKVAQPVNHGGQAGNPIGFTELDEDSRAEIERMRADWFPTGKPSGNQAATKKKKVSITAIKNKASKKEPQKKVAAKKAAKNRAAKKSPKK